MTPRCSPNQEIPTPSAVNVSARVKAIAKVGDETFVRLEYSPVA
jgi:hypothetical protein